MSPTNQQSYRAWLKKLGELTKRGIESSCEQGCFDMAGSPNTKAACSGWYVRIARVKNGGALLLFLDQCAHPDRHSLWYGFHATSEGRIRRIQRAGELVTDKPTIEDASDRPVRSTEYGKPFLEHVGASEYYYGIYTGISPENAQVSIHNLSRSISDFGTSVVEMVSSLEMPQEATRRIRRDVAARQGQGKFRQAVMRRFQQRCCVTGCAVPEALEAAHIAVSAGKDDHRAENGLLLRSDIHTLFDCGVVRIHPKTLVVHVDTNIQEKAYRDLHGKGLRCSPKAKEFIDRQALEMRWVSAGCWER